MNHNIQIDPKTIKIVIEFNFFVCVYTQQVLAMEDSAESTEAEPSSGDPNKKGSVGKSKRVSACLTTLHMFAKTRPLLLVEHAQTLQPYLSIACNNKTDNQVSQSVSTSSQSGAR